MTHTKMKVLKNTLIVLVSLDIIEGNEIEEFYKYA